MPARQDVLWEKALESLAGAEAEFAHGRYNNCANRCYYACFQAAIAELIAVGVRPPTRRDEWPHAFVQAQFVEQLILRRKVYAGAMRDVLSRAYVLRELADYDDKHVSAMQAQRVLRRSQGFIQALSIRRRGGR